MNKIIKNIVDRRKPHCFHQQECPVVIEVANEICTRLNIDGEAWDRIVEKMAENWCDEIDLGMRYGDWDEIKDEEMEGSEYRDEADQLLRFVWRLIVDELRA